jgi:hypothetical protein
MASTDARVAAAWPLPYHAQVLHTQDGVLIDFGDGNKAGGLSIRTKSGTMQDYATRPDSTFQHRTMTCFAIPTKTVMCNDWPRQIVPKKTVVRVTYWNGDNGPGPGIPGPVRIVKDVSAI